MSSISGELYFTINCHSIMADGYKVIAHTLRMSPDPSVLKVAIHMSTMPGIDSVSVEMHARSRWLIEKGQVVREFPDINHFYSNMTSSDVWAWSCYGEYPADSSQVEAE